MAPNYKKFQILAVVWLLASASAYAQLSSPSLPSDPLSVEDIFQVYSVTEPETDFGVNKKPIKVDILWVVDDSISMDPYQNLAAKNAEDYIKTLNENQVDFNNAVISTSLTVEHTGLETKGQLNSAAEKKHHKIFLRRFKKAIKLGTDGALTEKPLDSVLNYLKTYGQQFLRKDALFFIFFLSDIDSTEGSSVNGFEFSQVLAEFKPLEKTFVYGALGESKRESFNQIHESIAGKYFNIRSKFDIILNDFASEIMTSTPRIIEVPLSKIPAHPDQIQINLGDSKINLKYVYENDTVGSPFVKVQLRNGDSGTLKVKYTLFCPYSFKTNEVFPLELLKSKENIVFFGDVSMSMGRLYENRSYLYYLFSDLYKKIALLTPKQKFNIILFNGNIFYYQEAFTASKREALEKIKEVLNFMDEFDRVVVKNYEPITTSLDRYKLRLMDKIFSEKIEKLFNYLETEDSPYDDHGFTAALKKFSTNATTIYLNTDGDFDEAGKNAVVEAVKAAIEAKMQMIIKPTLNAQFDFLLQLKTNSGGVLLSPDL